MARVRVFLEPDLRTQHLAEAPNSETARRWTGTTSCEREGELVWVPGEHVDNGMACRECVAREGSVRPPLDGDHAGPV